MPEFRHGRFVWRLEIAVGVTLPGRKANAPPVGTRDHVGRDVLGLTDRPVGIIEMVADMFVEARLFARQSEVGRDGWIGFVFGFVDDLDYCATDAIAWQDL